MHRPIGLDIGSKAPAEIAVSTLAGLLADRNGRAGGFAHARLTAPVSDVLLGADLGTSGLKLVALDDGGAVVAEAEARLRRRPAGARAGGDRRRAPGGARSTRRSPRSAPALGGRRRAGAGHRPGRCTAPCWSTPPGPPLRPAVLWPDRRAAAELDRWRALPAADRAALANPLAPGMTGPMLAWLARHEPAAVARAAAVLLPKDALRAALVPGIGRRHRPQRRLGDPAVGRRRRRLVGRRGRGRRDRRGLLPDVRPRREVVGTAALTIGEVPVVVGGADTPLALLAAGTDRGRCR